MRAGVSTLRPPIMTGTESTPDQRWQAAYQEQRAALLGFLRRQVHDEALAEDLLQETFVRAIRSGRAGEGPERLRSYLFTIAQNLTVDHFRRSGRTVPLDGAGATEEGEEVQIEDTASESPEASTRRRALLRRLHEALGLLPDRHRTAFRMAAIEQRSYREIEAATGWTLDQVRINVHRARKRLIAELGDQLA